MKMSKRLLSLLLVLAMVFSMIPMSIAAEETETPAQPESAEEYVLFEDTFDTNENLSKWKTRWSKNLMSLAVDGGNLVLTTASSDTGAAIYAPGYEWTEYEFTTTLNTDPAVAPTWQDVLFLADEAMTDYYYVRVFNATGRDKTVFLYHYANSTATMIGSSSGSTIGHNESEVKVVIKDGKADVYMVGNTSPTVSATLAEGAKGTVGYRVISKSGGGVSTTVEGMKIVDLRDRANVTFDVDGEKTVASVVLGDVPEYTGATSFDANGYACTITGWDKEFAAVTGDVTYTATVKKDKILLDEPFEDAAAADDWAVQFAGAGITGTVVDGKLNISPKPTGDNFVTYTNGYNWTDYTVVADIEAPTSGYNSLVFRMADTGRNSYYHIRFLNGYAYVYEYIKGVSSNVELARFNVTKGQTYTVKVTVVGNSADITIGDVTKTVAVQNTSGTVAFQHSARDLTSFEGIRVVDARPEYDITWSVNGKTTVTTARKGDVPAYTGTTSWTEGNIKYTITGWDKEIVAATGAETYTAVLSTEALVLNETFDNADAAQDWTATGSTTTSVVDGELVFTPSGSNMVYAFYKNGYDWTDYEVTVDWDMNAFWNGIFIRGTDAKTGYALMFLSGKVHLRKYNASYSGGYISCSSSNWDTSYKDLTVTIKVVDNKITWSYTSADGAYTNGGSWTDNAEDAYDKGTIGFYANGGVTVKHDFLQVKDLRPQYEVTWSVNGTETTEIIAKGETPVYTGATTWSDAQHRYTITGWTPEIEAVSGNVTYTAIVETEDYLLNEDFNDAASLDNWTTENKGTYSIEDGKLVATAVGGNATKAFYTAGSGWSNYEFTATFDTTGTWNGPIWRVSEDGKSYYFLRLLGGNALLRRIDNGTITEIKANGFFKYTDGTTFDLTVKAVGNTFTFYIDGVKKATATDDGAALLKGSVGLYGYEGETNRFENAQVIDLRDEIEITWNVNGETTTSSVMTGQKPEFTGATSWTDGKYEYTITGWDKEIVDAYEAATYTAVIEKNTILVDVDFDSEADIEGWTMFEAQLGSWVVEDGALNITRLEGAAGSTGIPVFYKPWGEKWTDFKVNATVDLGEGNGQWMQIYVRSNGTKPITGYYFYILRTANGTSLRLFKGSAQIGETRSPGVANLTGVQDIEITAIGNVFTIKIGNSNVYTFTDENMTEENALSGVVGFSATGTDKAIESLKVVGIGEYYNITWDVEGTEEDQSNMIPAGEVPFYAYGTPSKKHEDPAFGYEFKGWDANGDGEVDEIVAAAADVTYTPVFEQVAAEYSIKWVVGEETIVDSAFYGETPEYDGELTWTDGTYTYTITGWSPEIVPVTGGATYTATVVKTKITYTITWIVGDSQTTETYEIGETPDFGEIPTKAEDENYTYEFSSWSPAIAPVTGDATYTAQFTATEKKPAGTITDTGITLALEGLTYVNQYVKITGFTGVDIAKNGGLLIWTTPVTEETAVYGTQKHIVEGLIKAGSEYVQQTTGIRSMEYADTLYIRVYVKDLNGNYVYSSIRQTSVREYCEGRIEKSTDTKLVNTAIAMLHYGAASQLNFKYNTGDLANKNIAEAHPNKEWDANLLDDLVAPNTKIVGTDKIQDTGKTLSLGEAIQMNFYIKPIELGTIKTAKMYFWQNVSGELTFENATKFVDMIKAGTEFVCTSDMITAVDYGTTIYACAYLVDSNGNEYYSNVFTGSPESYAKNVLAKSTSSAELKAACRAFVLYGEAAKINFSK